MPKADTLTAETRFIGLFVGESGSGKTVAECTFPKPLKVEDFDGRIRGILGVNFLTDEDKKGIEYEYYPPKEPNLITKIENNMQTKQIMSQSGRLDLKTLVTDSVTTETFAFLSQSIPLTHKENKGRKIGPLAMAGIEDYGFQSQAMMDYIAWLKSLPIPNIIISAHIVPVTQLSDPDNPFSQRVKVGEKLSITEKLAANLPTSFDHIFKFEKETIGTVDKYYVTFRGGIARTAYAQLPAGKIDITGKRFYDVMMGYIRGEIK